MTTPWIHISRGSMRSPETRWFKPKKKNLNGVLNNLIQHLQNIKLGEDPNLSGEKNYWYNSIWKIKLGEYLNSYGNRDYWSNRICTSVINLFKENLIFCEEEKKPAISYNYWFIFFFKFPAEIYEKVGSSWGDDQSDLIYSWYV